MNSPGTKCWWVSPTQWTRWWSRVCPHSKCVQSRAVPGTELNTKIRFREREKPKPPMTLELFFQRCSRPTESILPKPIQPVDNSEDEVMSEQIKFRQNEKIYEICWSKSAFSKMMILHFDGGTKRSADRWERGKSRPSSRKTTETTSTTSESSGVNQSK